VTGVRGRLVLVALLWLQPGPAAWAQTPPPGEMAPVVEAVRLEDGEVVRVDGMLDEPAWARARPASGFRQREPDSGAPATEGSEVRVLYDARRLLIGAALRDAEPEAVVANQMQRDQSFSADDRFTVALDTFLDGRGGYVFQTNPLGALFDALIAPGGNPTDSTTLDFGAAINPSWDGIWTVQVRRDAGGWVVEMEIPFSTLNFDPELSAWGINFHRTVRRKVEESLWTGYLRNEGVAHMASAGRLEGLRGLSQGLGLDLKPYVVGNVSSAPGRGAPGAVSTGDVGADLFYNLTPALRATLSVNTDFAETEVDERRVNITRFPLFFEEKRDFFLQGASYFDFAREIGDQVTPFFSRRIGLAADGTPQGVDVGGKLTGQAGAYDVGLLQVRTEDVPAEPGSDFTVARLRRRFMEESYAGVLYTRRADRGAGLPVRETIGLDYVLRTSRFRGSRTVEWSGWFLHTTNPLGTGGDIGRGSRLAFPNDPFYFDFSYRELQSHYDPAVGFLGRRGIRRYNPEIGYTWRFVGHPWLRSVQQEIDWSWIDDMDNRRLSEAAAIRPLTLVFADGSELAYEAEPTHERLEEDFEVGRGVTLPAGGEYGFTRHQVSASMADRYVVALGGQATFGSFYSGTGAEYQLNVRVRPRPGVLAQIEAERNMLDLAEGQVDTLLLRVLANMQLSPWISVVNNLQYDDVSGQMGWQVRFRWIRRPGNDLYLVYTQNWHDPGALDGARFATLDRRLAGKLVYTLRF